MGPISGQPGPQRTPRSTDIIIGRACLPHGQAGTVRRRQQLAHAITAHGPEVDVPVSRYPARHQARHQARYLARHLALPLDEQRALPHPGDATAGGGRAATGE